MIDPFVFESMACRVVFGSGTLASAGAEIERMGGRRALILTTPRQVAKSKELATSLGALHAGIFSSAVMHTPVDVTERALAVMRACKADTLVSLGGGSATGLGKALALRTGVNQLCIPTTYAGSEMTPILGETKGGLKTTLRDLTVLPETVLYDVDLTLALPVDLSVASGFNAMAHAVEALYARDQNPVTSLMAESAIQALARALPAIAAQPDDPVARAEALYGAWLGGTCLGTVGMALHHKLCHTFGGHIRSATRGNPHHRAASCLGVQCAGNSRGDGPDRSSGRCRGWCTRTLRSGWPPKRQAGAVRYWHARQRDRDRRRPRHE